MLSIPTLSLNHSSKQGLSLKLELTSWSRLIKNQAPGASCLFPHPVDLGAGNKTQTLLLEWQTLDKVSHLLGPLF